MRAQPKVLPDSCRCSDAMSRITNLVRRHDISFSTVLSGRRSSRSSLFPELGPLSRAEIGMLFCARAKMATIAQRLWPHGSLGRDMETSPKNCLKEVAIQVRPAGKRAPAIDPPRVPQTSSRTRDFSHICAKAAFRITRERHRLLRRSEKGMLRPIDSEIRARQNRPSLPHSRMFVPNNSVA